MDKQRNFRLAATLILAVILVMGLAACTRSKATPQVATQAPLATPTVQSMGIFETLNTPAPATEGTGSGIVGEAPLVATATAEVVVVAQPVAPVIIVPAPVVAVPVAMPTQGPPPATYTLKAGEHPFCIARRFNVNQSELLNLNGLNVNSGVAAGAVLKIPQTGNPFVSERALKAHPTQYTVTSGDTIYRIACAFGDVDPIVLAAYNGLSDPYTLSAGQILQIP